MNHKGTTTDRRSKYLAAFCMLLSAGASLGANRLDSYYAHKTHEDEFGVIAPWHTGQNGQLDERLRLAIEVYKRYPWADSSMAVQPAPDFVYNSHWSISDAGEIGIPPTTDWMCGDLSQRAWSIVKGLTDYYRYSGDPVAFTYIELTINYILDYGLTSADYEGWPEFPISNPTFGKIRGKCDERGRIQLDFCARLGEDVLTAYKLTGNPRYWRAVTHWGDLIAAHCNFDPELPPWDRYANPWVVGWSDKLTGSTAMICEFLDELIRSGYTGKDGAILRARDAGRAYLRDQMLPQWTKNEVWGRNYWDWDNPVTCGIVSMCGDYMLKYREGFPNWRNDLRNVLSLIFNRNGVDPASMGDTYSGAWAFPESSTCCGTSLSYCQYTAAPTFIRFGAIANDPWAREIGRRMILMATYDSDERGVVKDGLLGQQVATGEWSNLAHPWSLCQIMEALAWMPEEFGPCRENHVMRSTSVVNRITYAKGRIEYTTFDAPPETIDVARLAFLPVAVRADGKDLPECPALDRNGFTAKALGGGDYLVTIRHDNHQSIVIEGDADPQEVAAIGRLKTEGEWKTLADETASGGSLLVASAKGAAAICRFEGNQVRLIGHVDQQGGWADVYLDGALQNTLVECWNPHPLARCLLYERDGLAEGAHELKIVARGARNPLSGGENIYIDSVQTSAALGQPDYGSGGGPAGAQRMIFGFTGRKDYVDSQGNSWRPATEWVVRSGYGTDSVAQALWTDRRTMFIKNARDPELFRYGIHAKEFWVNVTVAPGAYNVRLLFANTPLHWFLEKDKDGGMVRHVMNAAINGRLVIENMDVGAEAGGNFVALEKRFENIEPKNGIIEIRCLGLDGREAMLQALEITPATENATK